MNKEIKDRIAMLQKRADYAFAHNRIQVCDLLECWISKIVKEYWRA